MSPVTGRGARPLPLLAIFSILALCVLAPSAGLSRVTGECSNCHAVHNSQDGRLVWDMIPLAGGPGEFLTKVNCISCHSSSDSEPTRQLGGNTTPVVVSTVRPAATTAGGNFYWVKAKGDAYGHNVIVNDTILGSAPGAGGATCNFGGCHASLATIRLSEGSTPVEGNGCIGCHVPKHHARRPAPGEPSTEATGCYRFLGRPSWAANIPEHSGRPGVEGIEDPDWELTVSPSDHNEYRDVDKPASPEGSTEPIGISEFCAGCHQAYHSWRYLDPNRDRRGTWLRHPAGDCALPVRGEYAAYTSYDPLVPVSRPTLGAVSSTVTPGVDRVMCLSCHRAHASRYPHMLRWDYYNLQAGQGCLVCHTSKG